MCHCDWRGVIKLAVYLNWILVECIAIVLPYFLVLCTKAQWNQMYNLKAVSLSYRVTYFVFVGGKKLILNEC